MDIDTKCIGSAIYNRFVEKAGKNVGTLTRKQDVKSATTGYPLSRQCPFNPGIILDSRDRAGECAISCRSIFISCVETKVEIYNIYIS